MLSICVPQVLEMIHHVSVGSHRVNRTQTLMFLKRLHLFKLSGSRRHFFHYLYEGMLGENRKECFLNIPRGHISLFTSHTCVINTK